MTEWQPIDTAPKDGTSLLLWPTLYRGQEPAIGSYRVFWGNTNPTWFVPGYGALKPTHWTPLPEPPDPEQEKINAE